MPLIAFSIKLDRIDEELLYRDPGGGVWLSCVCTLDEDPKGRSIVAQSIPPERYKAGERGPALGVWRKAKEKKGRWQDRYEGDLQCLDLLGLLEKLGIEATLIDGELDKHSILCPWHSEHSGDQKTGGSDTVVFVPEHKRPGFKCLHDHCSSRGLKELLEWAEAKDFATINARDVENVLWRSRCVRKEGSPRTPLPLHRLLLTLLSSVKHSFAFFDAHTIAARTSTETDVRLQQLLDLAADPCPDVREIALADIAREFPKYL